MDLGNIESLEKLTVSGLTISELPNSIGKLCKLSTLFLSGSKNLKTLPDTICDLGSLEILNVSSCESLKILPDKLWKLTRLRVLDLSESLLTALPSGIGQLSKLTNLGLRDCCRLLSISELPPNLKSIDAKGCRYMKSIPNLSNLKQLKKLNLDWCENLKEIQGFEGLISLERIDVGFCLSLREDTFTKRFFQVWLISNLYDYKLEYQATQVFQ